MANVFWTCLNMFSRRYGRRCVVGCAQSARQPIMRPATRFSVRASAGHSAVKYGSRRVFLFTNNDSPHEGDPSAARVAQTRARVRLHT